MYSAIVSTLLTLGFGSLLLLHLRRYARFEQNFIALGFVAHALGAVAQLITTDYYYGAGDMTLYRQLGFRLADWTRVEVFERMPGLLVLAAGGTPTDLPFSVIGAGGSTGAMIGSTAVIATFIGTTGLGVCLIFSFFAFLGQLGLYLGLRESFNPLFHRRLLAACFFVPSVVFWSSGILKESLALGGLGIAILGIGKVLFRGDKVRGAFAAAFGIAVLFVIKPYILFPLAIASAVWLYARRGGLSSGGGLARKWVYLMLSVALSVGGLHFLGKKYPQYSAANVATETAQLQALYYANQGGSTFEFGEATEERQIWYAPVALVSSLFRPFIFEVHNATSFVNALETTALLLLVIGLIRRTRMRRNAKLILQSPIMLFSVVFVLLFAVAVGLGAPNLGSLSRYRVPFMPLWFMIVFVLRPLPAKARREDASPAPPQRNAARLVERGRRPA